jgi:hypothetical protein
VGPEIRIAQSLVLSNLSSGLKIHESIQNPLGGTRDGLVDLAGDEGVELGQGAAGEVHGEAGAGDEAAEEAVEEQEREKSLVSQKVRGKNECLILESRF